MNRKHYMSPQVYLHEVHPAQMLALSIIRGTTADQNSDVLVKQNDWDIFDDDADEETSAESIFD